MGYHGPRMSLYCRCLCIVIQFNIIRPSCKQTLSDIILILTTGSNTVIQISMDIPIVKLQSPKRHDCLGVFEVGLKVWFLLHWLSPKWCDILDIECEGLSTDLKKMSWVIGCCSIRWACKSLFPIHWALINAPPLIPAGFRSFLQNLVESRGIKIGRDKSFEQMYYTAPSNNAISCLYLLWHQPVQSNAHRSTHFFPLPNITSKQTVSQNSQWSHHHSAPVDLKVDVWSYMIFILTCLKLESVSG